MSGHSIAKSLELSLLRPGMTRGDVADGCEEARSLHLAAVCVFPVHVTTAVDALAGSDTRVIAAVGCPWGQETLKVRLAAIVQARADGADDVAVALDHSLLVAAQLTEARRELNILLEQSSFASLVNSRASGNVTVVAETTLLDCPELAPLWSDLAESSAGFLQTSYGFSGIGVADDHLRMLRSLVPSDVGLKAVGAIGSLADAHSAVNAGAARVGSASALAIAVSEQQQRQEQVP